MNGAGQTLFRDRSKMMPRTEFPLAAAQIMQGRIAEEGNAFLEKNYPQLDGIKKATIE